MAMAWNNVWDTGVRVPLRAHQPLLRMELAALEEQDQLQLCQFQPTVKDGKTKQAPGRDTGVAGTAARNSLAPQVS
jgi:hypothetical protein